MNFYDPSAEDGRQVTRAVWNATITGLAAPGVMFVSAYYVLDTVRRVTQSGSLNSPGNLTEEETEAGEIRDREFPGREGCCHTGLARACVIPREASGPRPPGDTSCHGKWCDTKPQSNLSPPGCLRRGYPMARVSPTALRSQRQISPGNEAAPPFPRILMTQDGRASPAGMA